MDQRSFKNLLRRTVAIPVAMLVLLALVLAAEVLWLSSAHNWVDHSDRVIASARLLMRYMLDLETGVRGYHLTGDPGFLEPYVVAKSNVPEQIQHIADLVQDNPEQEARLRALRDLDLAWLFYAEKLLAQPPGKPISPQDYQMGKQLMDQIRAASQDFIGVEEKLRTVRSRRATQLSRVVVGSALGLSILIAIMLFTLTRNELWQLSRTYEQHLAAEEEKTRLLREREEWYQITLKSLGDAVVATDAEGRVAYLNPVAQSLTGWSEQDAIGRSLREVLHVVDERSRAEYNDPGDLVRREGSVVSVSNHVAILNHTGQEYPVELTGAPIKNDLGKIVGVVIVFRDIRQRRQTEQTLRSSERLTLAGRLSATIAHEIRNPLDTVANLLYLLQVDQQQTPESKQYLKLAADELGRITQITSQLLTFHREARAPVEVSLSEVLESVLALFAPQIRRSDIEVIKRFETLAVVRGFPGELRQVFSNLVGNALDALAAGGKLILHVREATVVWDHGRRGIRVTIIDNGPGIPVGVRKNLYAPFFTTKGEKGTGLGLWVSRGIVEKHEGTIHFSSNTREGRSGTAFSVFLPFQQLQDTLEEEPAGKT